MLDASFVIVCMGLIALGLLALRWSATNPGLLKATPLNIKLFHQDMATLSLKGSPSRLLSWGRTSACKCQRRTPKEETIINWVHPTGSFTPSLRKTYPRHKFPRTGWDSRAVWEANVSVPGSPFMVHLISTSKGDAFNPKPKPEH